MTTTSSAEQGTTQAESAAMRDQEPNQFDLHGDGASITYSTTSLAGVAQFNYQDKDHSVNRSGDDIRIEETEIARLVTIDIERVPDAYDRLPIKLTQVRRMFWFFRSRDRRLG